LVVVLVVMVVLNSPGRSTLTVSATVTFGSAPTVFTSVALTIDVKVFPHLPGHCGASPRTAAVLLMAAPEVTVNGAVSAYVLPPSVSAISLSPPAVVTSSKFSVSGLVTRTV
jgi:hypothetical protein